MALSYEEQPVHRITREELMRMVDAGVFEDPRPIELLDGVLFEVSEGDEHALLVMRLLQWLAPGLAAGNYLVRINSPLVVPDPYSLPQPDVAVVAPKWNIPKHPDESLLNVEVAVSSLRTDLRVKTAKYAEAGVPEYWVFDVRGRRVHVFTDPTPDGYGTQEERALAGTIAPSAVEVEPLDLAALFADLD